MDTRFLEVRKNIVIQNTFNNSSRFTQTINTVNFIPDEVIVKYINYSTADGEAFGTSIYTDMVSDVIGSICAPTFVSANLTYTLRKPISGQYYFELLDTAGQPVNNRGGDLFIHLEFVKYRTDLPDKKIF
jgi:hypothetical protein